MKKLFLSLACVLLTNSFLKAQSFTETFDSNSLEWTECAYENGVGTAIINEGKMTVTSKGENKGAGVALTMLTGVSTKVGENTFFETHCYAPLDVLKPFKIRTHVNIEKLSKERIAGLVFNYRDGGNFYCFTFNDESIEFNRYENGEIVGSITQSVIWKDKKHLNQEWELVSEGDVVSFVVDQVPILNVRYMPIQYSGFGYYTFGKQELIVDDVEFIQL